MSTMKLATKIVFRISLGRWTNSAPNSLAIVKGMRCSRHFSATRSLAIQRTPLGFAKQDIDVPPVESESLGNSDTIECGIYDREFCDMKVEDFEDLYRNDPEAKEKVKLILNEYEFNKYNSMGRVPSKLELVDMQKLLKEGESVCQRDKLFNFFFKREMAKRANKLRRERDKKAIQLKRQARLSEFSDRSRSGLLDEDGKVMYGLWHNSLFCRIPENKIKSGITGARLSTAAQFGRKLIFDFGFGDYMVNWTYRNAVDQIQESYGMNRYDYEEPFDLWFCNFEKNSDIGQYCSNKAIKNLYDGSMVTVKEDCFTNHFDKSRLVYLSPNAREPLGKILRDDDIYIIGVYNDKGNQQPVTFRKATKLGIRTKCLPLDHYLGWKGPSKSLCVNHVAGVLLEYMANGGDWYKAFMKHIPQRKIKPVEVVMEEEKLRKVRLNKLMGSPKFSLRRDLDL